MRFSKGFTLLELIVTIIIIGILAVTVLPRFFDSSGYEEYTYRAQAIAILRNIQLRSMQQAPTNDDNLCVLISSKLLGKPRKVADGGSCTSSLFGNDFGDGVRRAELKIDNGHEVTFSPMRFSFDKLGRPVGCANPCEIAIRGLENADIVIEPEGYIHAK